MFLPILRPFRAPSQKKNITETSNQFSFDTDVQTNRELWTHELLIVDIVSVWAVVIRAFSRVIVELADDTWFMLKANLTEKIEASTMFA